jgi:hypothetical protein
MPQMATDHERKDSLPGAPPTAGAIYVHFCNGEHRQVWATDVALRGDKLVCIDAGGHEVARFPARDVYMCARNHLPGVPL